MKKIQQLFYFRKRQTTKESSSQQSSSSLPQQNAVENNATYAEILPSKLTQTNKNSGSSLNSGEKEVVVNVLYQSYWIQNYFMSTARRNDWARRFYDGYARKVDSSTHT